MSWTDWTEPQFERAEVDKSGRILRDPGKHSADDLDWAFGVMDNWRASHAFPLNTVQVGLRRRAAAVDQKAFVVQRLKRAQSILKKLERQPSMRLSQMQDLGGCRAILRSTAGAARLRDRYLKGRTSLELAGMKDYVEEPRSSGYRSIHFVYKYRSGRIDSPAAYDGHLIEIQIRSQAQHAWATAVEIVGTVIGEALKASEGPREWLDLLRSISSLFAYAEGTPAVKGAAPRRVLAKEIKAEARRLRMAERLRRFRDALEVMGRTRTTTSRYFLLDLDPAAESLQITNYREGEIEAATEAYVRLERQVLEGRRRDVVLVRADSVEALTRAYPNYFLDAERFLEKVEELTS